MKHGSLFSGIGGFDLAAEWMGWEIMSRLKNSNRQWQNIKNGFIKMLSINLNSNDR